MRRVTRYSTNPHHANVTLCGCQDEIHPCTTVYTSQLANIWATLNVSKCCGCHTCNRWMIFFPKKKDMAELFVICERNAAQSLPILDRQSGKTRQTRYFVLSFLHWKRFGHYFVKTQGIEICKYEFESTAPFLEINAYRSAGTPLICACHRTTVDRLPQIVFSMMSQELNLMMAPMPFHDLSGPKGASKCQVSMI